ATALEGSTCAAGYRGPRRQVKTLLPARSPGNKLQIPNSKPQRSTRSQTPNTKLQTPEKLQAPSSKLEARAAVWSLELGISLVFGAWFLVFRCRDFFGVSSLGIGISSKTPCLDAAKSCSSFPPSCCFSSFFCCLQPKP